MSRFIRRDTAPEKKMSGTANEISLAEENVGDSDGAFLANKNTVQSAKP
jgi:hypothetical protein